MRKAVIQLFSDVAETYTGVFLSNFEMTTGVSSPTYDHFTQRVGVGLDTERTESVSTIQVPTARWLNEERPFPCGH